MPDSNIIFQLSPYGFLYAKSSNLPPHLVLPETLNGKRVIGVHPMAFANCQTLNSVTIPDSYSVIGSGAFKNCRNLESVEWQVSQSSERLVPDDDGGQLGIITLANEKQSKVHLIEGFSYIATKEKIIMRTMSNLHKVIESNAFRECVSLRRLVLHPDVVALSAGACYSDINLEELICYPQLQVFGEDCLANCHGLERLVISTSDPLFGKNALPTLCKTAAIGTSSKLMLAKVLLANSLNSRLLTSKENADNRQLVADCIQSIRQKKYIKYMLESDPDREVGLYSERFNSDAEDFNSILTMDELRSLYHQSKQEELEETLRQQQTQTSSKYNTDKVEVTAGGKILNKITFPE